MPGFEDIRLVFDATSAGAHLKHAKLCATGDGSSTSPPPPSARTACPVVNLEDHIDQPNVNMVTCGGQATVPIVAAVTSRRRCPTPRSCRRSSSRRSGHPRQHRRVHRDDRQRPQAAWAAPRSKAIIILNPAEPPS